MTINPRDSSLQCLKSHDQSDIENFRTKHSGSIQRNACRLQNIATCCVCNYQDSVTTGQTQTEGWTDGRTDGQTDAGQSDPYVPLCLAGDRKSPEISQFYVSQEMSHKKQCT